MQLLESIILGFWVFNCQRLFIPGVGGSEVRYYSLGSSSESAEDWLESLDEELAELNTGATVPLFFFLDLDLPECRLRLLALNIVE